MARAYTLRVNVLGDSRDAKRAMREFSSSVEAMRSKVTKAAGLASKALGVGLGVGLAAVVREGTSELLSMQQANAQTMAGIKSTGGVAGVTAKHVTTLANAMLRKTGIDDQAVQASENMLLTFTNVRNEVGKGNDIFDQATKGVADLATKMANGAVPTAEQMAKASVQMGKALNDPVKGISALSKVGVSFTAQQKDQIKTLVAHGKTTQAQKIILGELRKEFGGAAEAAGKTLGGQINILREGFSGFSANIMARVIPAVLGFAHAVGDAFAKGGKLRPILDGLRSVLSSLGAGLQAAGTAFVSSFTKHAGGAHTTTRSLAQSVQRLLEKFGKLASDTLPKIGSALGTAAGFLTRHSTAVKAVVVAIGAMVLTIKAVQFATKAWMIVQGALNLLLTANPVGLVVVAIAGLAAGMIYAYKHSERFRAIVDKVWAVIKVAAGWVKKYGLDMLALFSGPAAPFLLAYSHSKRFRDMTHDVAGKLTMLARYLGGAFKSIWDGMVSGFKKAKEMAEKLAKKLEPVADILKSIAKYAGKAGGAAKSVVGAVGDGSIEDMDIFGAGSAGGLKKWGLVPSMAPALGLGSLMGLSVSSGRRPGAITSTGNVSDHASGHAADEAGSPWQMMQYALAANRLPGVKQVIYSPLGWARGGGSFSPIPASAGTVLKDHYSHVHVSMYAKGGRVDRPELFRHGGGVGMRGEDGAEQIVPLSRKHRAHGLRNLVAAAREMGVPMFATGGRIPGMIRGEVARQGGDGNGPIADALIATARRESRLNPRAVGDHGTSFGLFQFHKGGALGRHTKEWAFDPMNEIRDRVGKFLAAKVTTGAGAAAIQRPADPSGYAAAVDGLIPSSSKLGATSRDNLWTALRDRWKHAEADRKHQWASKPKKQLAALWATFFGNEHKSLVDFQKKSGKLLSKSARAALQTAIDRSYGKSGTPAGKTGNTPADRLQALMDRWAEPEAQYAEKRANASQTKDTADDLSVLREQSTWTRAKLSDLYGFRSSKDFAKLSATDRASVTSNIAGLISEQGQVDRQLAGVSAGKESLWDGTEEPAAETGDGSDGADAAGGDAASTPEVSADMQAQLDQEKRRADVATGNLALSEAAVRAFGGPGDLGAGGGNALGAAYGQTVINVHTLHPGDPNTLAAIEQASRRGGAASGTAALTYNPRSGPVG